MDCSPPGSSVHGISQARVLEWVAISFSRGSFWSRDWTQVSCSGRQILYHWATREAPVKQLQKKKGSGWSEGTWVSVNLEMLRAPPPCPPLLLGEGPPRASPSAGCGPGACHLPPGSMSGFPNCLISLSLLEDKNILHYFLLTSSKAFTLKLSVTHLKFVFVYDMRQRPLSYFPLWIATVLSFFPHNWNATLVVR